MVMMMGPGDYYGERKETSPKAPGRSLGGETYLLGKNMGTQVLQRNLETTSIIIVENFDRNERVGTDRLSRLSWGGHGLLLSQLAKW